MREIVLPLALLCAAACGGETAAPASSGGNAPSASAATSGKSETRSAVGLKITVPSSWRDAGPQTTMNPSVKFVLPKADGDAEDGMVRIFRGAMGPKDANIQ